MQYKKAIDWLIRSIKARQEINFCTKISNEIKNIILNEITSSIKKKKEYYNYAIMFKSAKNFKL
jgi:ribosomal protein S7